MRFPFQFIAARGNFDGGRCAVTADVHLLGADGAPPSKFQDPISKVDGQYRVHQEETEGPKIKNRKA